MKKDIIPKIIFIILIIILVAMIIFAINRNKPKNLTLKMYNNICNKENYTFSMINKSSDVDYKLTIAKKGKDMSIDTLSGNEHTETLAKDGYVYYIMHENKEYYLYDSNEIDVDILRNNLKGIENEKYLKGFENINGKKYYYEEYERNINIYTFIKLQ